MANVDVNEHTTLLDDNPENLDSNITVVNLEEENSSKKKWGKWVSGGFALSCGANAAYALTTLIAGPVLYISAAVLGLATIYANYRMTNGDVSNIFIGGFKGLFQNKIVIDTTAEDFASEDLEPSYISSQKSLLVTGGLVLAALFGLTIAALTYASMTSLVAGAVAAIGITGTVSGIIPIALGAVMAILTFTCLTALMTKAFADIIKTENKLVKLKSMFSDLVTWDPERDRNKSIARFVLERALVCTALTAVAVGVIGLVVWGQLSTLVVCSIKFAEILAGITHCSASAAGIVSLVIAQVCGLVAQIPFILKTSLTPVLALFGLRKKSPQELVEGKPETTWKERIRMGGLVTSAFLSSAATAAIALTGKIISLLPALAGIGAFLNSFFGSVVNATLSEPVVEPRPELIQASSTSLVTKKLVLENTPKNSNQKKIYTNDEKTPESPVQLPASPIIHNRIKTFDLPNIHHVENKRRGFRV